MYYQETVSNFFRAVLCLGIVKIYGSTKPPGRSLSSKDSRYYYEKLDKIVQPQYFIHKNVYISTFIIRYRENQLDE